MTRRRLRILLSTFACRPGSGSEEGVGWSWVERLAREHDVVALVDGSFRSALDAALDEHPRPSLRVVYGGRGPAGYEGLDVYPYYARWQRWALTTAQRLHAEEPFDLAHHVTYGMHRVASLLHELPVPFVWGPIGGAEGVRPTFYAPRWVGGWRQTANELVRAAWNVECRADPRLRAAARGATVIAVKHPDTLRSLPRTARCKAVVLGGVTIAAEDRAVLASSQPPPVDPRGLSVAFAGRLLGWKGPLLAVESFARYAADHPAATFDVYGDGPAAGAVRERAAALGVADRVTLHGRVPRADLLLAYGRHHVLLLPSLHDSSGWVPVEAMAAGLPVVCVDAGGTGAAVPDDGGCKVPATAPRRAVEAMATALRDLTADPARWAACSARARAQALDGAATPSIAAQARLLYGRAGFPDAVADPVEDAA